MELATLWTTVAGYLPLTAPARYLGSNAHTLSLDDPLAWIAVAAATLLLGARALRRRA